MRFLIRTAVVALAIGGATVAAAVPARAVDVFIEVNPATIQAGSTVALRASCGESVTSGTVRSEAFGTVPVTPQNGFLVATVGVPSTRKAGNYTVRLTCPSGRAATTTLVVLGTLAPATGPHTGGGGLASDPSDSSDRRLLVGGLALIGMGSLLGAYALRRRRMASRT